MQSTKRGRVAMVAEDFLEKSWHFLKCQPAAAGAALASQVSFQARAKNESLEWETRLENNSKKCGVHSYHLTPIHGELGTKIPVGSVLILLFKAIY